MGPETRGSTRNSAFPEPAWSSSIWGRRAPGEAAARGAGEVPTPGTVA